MPSGRDVLPGLHISEDSSELRNQTNEASKDLY
jgi:hypothetical protein